MDADHEKFLLALGTRLDQAEQRDAALVAEFLALNAKIDAIAAQVNTVHEDVRMRNAYTYQGEKGLAKASEGIAAQIIVQQRHLTRASFFLIGSSCVAGMLLFVAGLNFAMHIFGIGK